MGIFQPEIDDLQRVLKEYGYSLKEQFPEHYAEAEAEFERAYGNGR